MNYTRCVLFLVIVFAVLLAGCAGGAVEPTPAPSIPSTVGHVSAPTSIPNTPTLTATPPGAPTAIPTRVPTATPFITPPASGQTATVPILMYHHLADLPNNASQLQMDWTVAPKNFESQMDWLAERGYHAVTIGQLAAHLKRNQPLPAKPIVITFDDGWADGYTVAFPILKKHNFSGTFYVYTNALDHTQFLTWAQVEEMSAAGMDFQSHTLSHPHLRKLTPEAAMKEIADSKAILEERLSKPVTSFDYPFGEYNASVIDLVKRAGFESAVSIAAGYKQRADEIYALHRIRISYPDTVQDMAKRLP
jgi:peptidoglycan/xylan/chitin deacetylase (PgdA/CDA1 family)